MVPSGVRAAHARETAVDTAVYTAKQQAVFFSELLLTKLV